jgi:hypothetical protein
MLEAPFNNNIQQNGVEVNRLEKNFFSNDSLKSQLGCLKGFSPFELGGNPVGCGFDCDGCGVDECWLGNGRMFLYAFGGRVVGFRGHQTPSLLDTIEISEQPADQPTGFPPAKKPLITSRCGNDWVALRCYGCGSVVRFLYFCGKRTCPVCSRVRSRELQQKYIPYVFSFKYPAFLTLTLTRQQELQQGVDFIIKSFKKLRRKLKIRKGLYTVEILVKNDGYHIHLHCIADIVWISQEKISREWEKLTGAMIVDIRRVKNKIKAIKELIKYITKMWEIKDEQKRKKIEEALKHRRLINWFGEKPKIETKFQPKMKCPHCGSTDLVFLGVFTDEEFKKKFGDTS